MTFLHNVCILNATFLSEGTKNNFSDVLKF